MSKKKKKKLAGHQWTAPNVPLLLSPRSNRGTSPGVAVIDNHATNDVIRTLRLPRAHSSHRLVDRTESIALDHKRLGGRLSAPRGLKPALYYSDLGADGPRASG